MAGEGFLKPFSAGQCSVAGQEEKALTPPPSLPFWLDYTSACMGHKCTVTQQQYAGAWTGISTRWRISEQTAHMPCTLPDPEGWPSVSMEPGWGGGLRRWGGGTCEEREEMRLSATC